MGHGHGHGHAAGRAVDRSRLRKVLGVTVVALVAQLVGAWWSGSLALLADAGHLATDAGAVLLALAAGYMASRPATHRRTFGWHRAEVLAALANAVALLAVGAYLLVEGVRRLQDPPAVDVGPMAWFALLGLVANAVSLALLHDRQAGSLNVRGAYLEVLSDLPGSAAVLVAAILVLVTDAFWPDPAATLLIAVVIVPRALVLAKEAAVVLLEATPEHVDPEELRRHLVEVPGVVDVHDLHVWTITSGLHSLSVHVAVDDLTLEREGVGPLLNRFSTCVSSHFDIEHPPFQIEPVAHREHEELGEHLP